MSLKEHWAAQHCLQEAIAAAAVYTSLSHILLDKNAACKADAASLGLEAAFDYVYTNMFLCKHILCYAFTLPVYTKTDQNANRKRIEMKMFSKVDTRVKRIRVNGICTGK